VVLVRFLFIWFEVVPVETVTVSSTCKRKSVSLDLATLFSGIFVGDIMTVSMEDFLVVVAFCFVSQSQANIFGNNVINSVETDVSVPNENTVNDATAYPSANPMNNILTTRSNSIAFQTIISANNIVKSVETDVSVLVEHIANVTITTSTPLTVFSLGTETSVSTELITLFPNIFA
jgi:hypothetical protein